MPRSEEPDEELCGEEGQAAAEHDPGNLTLRPHLSEHEGESAYHDRHQGERARERSGERSFKVACRTLPGRSALCRGDLRKEHEHSRNKDELCTSRTRDYRAAG